MGKVDMPYRCHIFLYTGGPLGQASVKGGHDQGKAARTVQKAETHTQSRKTVVRVGGGAASANHAVSVSMAFYRPQRNEGEEAMATLAVSVAAL